MKRSVAERYNKLFEGNRSIELPVEPSNYFSVYWMYALKIKESSGFNAKQLRDVLNKRGIETREGFTCYSDQQKLHEQYGFKVRETPVATQIQSQVLYLPSGPKISNADLKRVAKEVNLFFGVRHEQ
jgi:dTDP-4-amino-4,6-dideoxygalactose transaminase